MGEDKITVDLDVKELYGLVCNDCKERVREFTRKKIKGQIQDRMLDNMADQALGQIMPAREQTPKRVLPAARTMKAK